MGVYILETIPMRAHYASPSHLSVSARGILKNYNTIEEFKNADKRALFNKLSDEVCAAFLCRLHFACVRANRRVLMASHHRFGIALYRTMTLQR